MDLEEQLQEQLAEQQEALAGVKELLEADPDSEEMAALLDELQTGVCLFHSPAAQRRLHPALHCGYQTAPSPTAGTLVGIRDTEAALLGLKRQRLLQELDALHGGSDQQLELQGEQAGQAATAAEAAAAAAAGAGTGPAAHLQPGATCIFRQTDGRHYWGRVLESAGDSVSVQPLFPTR